MRPTELILLNWDLIIEAYSETGSWKKVYEMVKPLKAIGLNTVKQYCSIIMEVKQRLNSDDGLNRVKQELEAVKQELDRTNELNKVRQTELDQVKQELNRQAELNKVIQAELDRVKQERDEVKQELDRSERLNKVIQIDTVKQELDRTEEREAGNMIEQDKADTVKQKLNIAGWNIQQGKDGYYRAFRKIGGKLRAVYLGKSIDGAEAKLIGK